MAAAGSSFAMLEANAARFLFAALAFAARAALSASPSPLPAVLKSFSRCSSRIAHCFGVAYGAVEIVHSSRGLLNHDLLNFNSSLPAGLASNRVDRARIEKMRAAGEVLQLKVIKLGPLEGSPPLDERTAAGVGNDPPEFVQEGGVLTSEASST